MAYCCLEATTAHTWPKRLAVAVLCSAAAISPQVLSAQDGPRAVAPVEQTLAQYLAGRNEQIQLFSGPLRLQLEYPKALIRDLVQIDPTAQPTPNASILQFDAPLTRDTRAALEAEGIRIEEYLGGTTYLVSIVQRATDAPAFSTLDAITVAGAPLLPGDKITPAALRPIETRLPHREAETAEPSLSIGFLSVVSEERARADLAGIGIEVLRKVDDYIFAVRNGAETAKAVAALPSVKVVDAGPTPFLPLNDTGRRVSESDQAQRFSLGGVFPTYGGVSGLNARVGIADTGVDENHDDFDEIALNGSAGPTRIYATSPGGGSHGTHVASIAGGSGFNSNANAHPDFALRGHAPWVQIGDYAPMGATVANYHTAIVSDATDVTNHSYVQTADASYGTAAATIDRIVRGDATHNNVAIPAKPQVWAAGNNGVVAQYGANEGYYAAFTSAKNSISVGSVDTRDRRLSDFSSLGPTFDGRIKPDIVAPGCIDSILRPRAGILAASSGTQGYTGMCGTSMAAPVVTGTIALMINAYINAFGAGRPNLRPSTYKALLIQTARDLIKTAAYPAREFNNPDTGAPLLFHAGPDFATGYGLVDVDAVTQSISDSSLWSESILVIPGEEHTWCMDVPAGAGEVKASLAWDDEPGSTITAQTTSKLVNDLDLELLAPDGTVVRPWTLDPLPVTANPGSGAPDPITAADVVPARRGVDRRNNVEMAHVSLPQVGEWRIRVRAFNLPNGRAQTYSIATSHQRMFCRRTPPQFVFPEFGPQICAVVPKLCTSKITVGPRIQGALDWRRPIPVGELCRFVVDCPHCDSGGTRCPGLRVALGELPRAARVTVFDDAGRVNYSGRGATQKFEIENRTLGVEHFIFVSGPDGEPYATPFRPRMEIKPSVP
jgi:subtilisin family serine protease